MALSCYLLLINSTKFLCDVFKCMCISMCGISHIFAPVDLCIQSHFTGHQFKRFVPGVIMDYESLMHSEKHWDQLQLISLVLWLG